MSETILDLRHVSKTYQDGDRKIHVLQDVDIQIETGEWVVLLGRSGSGKSTLLNLAGGIDVPDDGFIEINGQSIIHMSETQRTIFRRHHLGFIFQFFNLIPTLTVEENLLLPLELLGSLSTSGRQYAMDLLERTGLVAMRRRFPEQLSGGEQQRVAVARALVHQPDLVLADEPTGNLDDETSEAVMALLTDLQRETQMTLFMVTHNSDVAELASRSLYMHDGRISGSGD